MPTIVAKGVPQYIAGDHMFKCEISWSVASGEKDGWIVQRVQRNEKFTYQPVFGAAKQVVIANDYWEVWHLVNGKAEPNENGINDNFAVGKATTLYGPGGAGQMCPNKEKTKGKWKIRGLVYYVPENQFDAAGWTSAMDPVTAAIRPLNQRLNAVMEAGRLLSRYTPPAPGNGLVQGGSLGAVCLTRKHAGEWDFRPDAQRGLLEKKGIYHQARSFPMSASFNSRTQL